jgi:hypothetical protein
VSLDVYLQRKRAEKPEALRAVELLESNGFDEIADEVRCHHDCSEYDMLYDANITHNLNRMASAAGIYEEMWRPEELGITRAEQLIKPLSKGLERLLSDPEKFRQFDASNGWGTYEHFVPFVQAYRAACEEYPDAEVRVSR